MAKIIGGITSSHIPAVGNAISQGLTQEPYWKRFSTAMNQPKTG